MKLAVALTAIACALPAAAFAESASSTLQPQVQHRGDAPSITSGGPYEALLKEVQEKLNARGFDPGPANGAFTSKTQAALAQFQRANVLPASGAMDDATLAELGVERGATSATENVVSEEKPEAKPGEEQKLSEKQ